MADPRAPEPRRLRGPDRDERELEHRPLAVRLDHELASPHPTTAPSQAREERQPETPAWHRDRLVVVPFRVATGAEEIDRLGLEPGETERVLQRAVNRTYSFLEREGIRDNFIHATRGRSLDVRVLVPERLGWTADERREGGRGVSSIRSSSRRPRRRASMAGAEGPSTHRRARSDK